MQVKLIAKNKDKTQYTFMVKSAEPYILNALRRSIISLVPTMAIENVEVRLNSSILYDEVMAHRLGLIPLTTDLKNYEVPKSPEDEESLKCTVKFTLKAKGPKVVYSGDLKSADPAVVPINEGMPIVKLLKGQELALECIAMLGIGKTHMKWSPGIVFYKNKPIVEVKSNVNIDKLKAAIPAESALKISGNKVTVDDDLLYTTSYFDAFYGEDVVDGVKVSYSEDEFVFNVESFGQLSVKEMLTEGIESLKERLEELDSKLNK
jgi:DNA-directed RNA polymerase subunit D